MFDGNCLNPYSGSVIVVLAPTQPDEHYLDSVGEYLRDQFTSYSSKGLHMVTVFCGYSESKPQPGNPVGHEMVNLVASKYLSGFPEGDSIPRVIRGFHDGPNPAYCLEHTMRLFTKQRCPVLPDNGDDSGVNPVVVSIVCHDKDLKSIESVARVIIHHGWQTKFTIFSFPATSPNKQAPFNKKALKVLLAKYKVGEVPAEDKITEVQEALGQKSFGLNWWSHGAIPLGQSYSMGRTS